MPVKVLSLEEPRAMDNGTVICEGLVGDETGTVIMSFWNDECETVSNGMTIDLKDARANLVRGHMRISLGKKGSMKEATDSLETVKESVNLSDLEYEMLDLVIEMAVVEEAEAVVEGRLVAGAY